MCLHDVRRKLIPPFLLLLMMAMSGLFADHGLAKTLYSYNDEKGTRVITDNYNHIPAHYRNRVVAVEQEADHPEIERVSQLIGSTTKGFALDLPGMSFQQSKIITYASLIALLCLLVINFSRGELIRMLALWCLVMTGLCAPVLVYIADDGAGTIMKKKATEIQRQQQDRLSQIQ